MTERLTDTQLDHEVRAFLAWQSGQIAGAPSAGEMTIRVRARVQPTGLALWPRNQERAVLLLVLASLLAALIAAGAFVGASRIQPPASVQNGWIAVSSQPGHVQTSETDWAEGGDIYLVRDGVDPRVIVERGPDMKRNVCPHFSPDGSKLVYGELSGTAGSLVVLEVTQDGNVSEWRRLRLPGTSRVAPCPRWSRNGTHIAYLESVETGVAVVDLDGVRVAPTADDPGNDHFTHSESDPLLSPDGSLRAVRAPDGGVLVGPADGSAARKVSPGGYSIAAWSPDSTRLVALSDAGRHATMLVVSLTEPARTTHFAPSFPVNGARSWPGRGDVSWQPIYP